MKLKVDENLPREVADLLREARHDAITVADEGLGGRPDGTIASLVRRLGVLRLNRQDKPHVLQVIARLIPVFAREEPKGHLWIVEEDQVRIRP
jgi:predicted nuclease of predicted toxin-antitoxin system